MSFLNYGHHFLNATVKVSYMTKKMTLCLLASYKKPSWTCILCNVSKANAVR